MQKLEQQAHLEIALQTDEYAASSMFAFRMQKRFLDTGAWRQIHTCLHALVTELAAGHQLSIT